MSAQSPPPSGHWNELEKKFFAEGDAVPAAVPAEITGVVSRRRPSGRGGTLVAAFCGLALLVGAGGVYALVGGQKSAAPPVVAVAAPAAPVAPAPPAAAAAAPAPAPARLQPAAKVKRAVATAHRRGKTRGRRH